MASRNPSRPFNRWLALSALALWYAISPRAVFAQTYEAASSTDYNAWDRFPNNPTKGFTFGSPGWASYLDTAPSVLHWRFAADLSDLGESAEDGIFALRDVELANAVGDARQRVNLSIARKLGPALFSGERKHVNHIMGGSLVAYRIPAMPQDAGGLRELFDFAKEMNIETIITQTVPDNMGPVRELARAYDVNVAICAPFDAMIRAFGSANLVITSSDAAGVISDGPRRVGACLDERALASEGVSVSTAVDRLKHQILIVELAAESMRPTPCDTQCILGSLYKHGVKPSLIVMRSSTKGSEAVPQVQRALNQLEPVLRPLVANEAMKKSQGKGQYANDAKLAPLKLFPALGAGNNLEWEPVTPDRKAAVDAALPSKAIAKPTKVRKLLVLTLNLGYGGHASIPTLSYAIQELGRRTGAYDAIFDNNLENLKFPAIKQYDAIFLNNAAGLIFSDPEVRNGLLRFVREGGGIGGLHAASHASLDWAEFQEMLGAYPGSHLEATERVWLKVDDQKSPINAAFQGRDYLFQDQFFRFLPPYDRSKLRVLLSINTERTDMSQLSDALRESLKAWTPGENMLRVPDMLGRQDGDYAVSWVKPYGRGRVFYTALGDVPTLFMDPIISRHMLGGLQYILGDLRVDDAPDVRTAR